MSHDLVQHSMLAVQGSPDCMQAMHVNEPAASQVSPLQHLPVAEQSWPAVTHPGLTPPALPVLWLWPALVWMQ
jgi:hypothetical protein